MRKMFHEKSAFSPKNEKNAKKVEKQRFQSGFQLVFSANANRCITLFFIIEIMFSMFFKTYCSALHFFKRRERRQQGSLCAAKKYSKPFFAPYCGGISRFARSDQRSIHRYVTRGIDAVKARYALRKKIQ